MNILTIEKLKSWGSPEMLIDDFIHVFGKKVSVYEAEDYFFDRCKPWFHWIQYQVRLEEIKEYGNKKNCIGSLITNLIKFFLSITLLTLGFLLLINLF